MHASTQTRSYSIVSCCMLCFTAACIAFIVLHVLNPSASNYALTAHFQQFITWTRSNGIISNEIKNQRYCPSSCAFYSSVNTYLGKSHSSTHAMILHSRLLHTQHAPLVAHTTHPALQSTHRPKTPVPILLHSPPMVISREENFGPQSSAKADAFVHSPPRHCK